MSFYSKGKAHKISAMASKSCNAVSARDLFVPLTATVNVDLTHRTFTIDVVATCYFGTRINIENIFHDMQVDHEVVPNYTVNGWVNKDEPGKQIATYSISGSYNAEGIPSIREKTIPITGQMTYYKDVGCTKQAEIPFFNEVQVLVDNIEPHYTQPAKPTIASVSALDTALEVNVETTSFGDGGGRYLYVEASKTNDFAKVKTSNVIDTLTGTCRVSNLQPNTFYYVRAVCANNGMSRNGDSQKTATLASGYITRMYIGKESIRVNTKVNQRVDLDAVVINGGRAYSTKVYLQRSRNGVNWFYYGHYPTTPYIDVSTIHDLNVIARPDESEYKYYRMEVITDQGSYFSPAYEFDFSGLDTGDSDSVWGAVNSVTAPGGIATVKYYANARTSQQLKITTYYRPYGMEEEWIELPSQTYSSSNTERTAPTITGLVPNYAIYEVSLHIEGLTTGEEYDTEPWQFYTTPLQVINNTCDSLDYMVQLICQTYNAIKQGNITVYMNDDTKKWCEGEDGIPTLAAIMSRIDRYMHTVGCILCSMEGFIELLKESSPTQVFMGQMGWVDCDDEPTAGSVYPVLSDGIHAAIDELIHQVWHYVGEYDYYAYNPLELNAQSGTATGQTAVMGNKKYKWNGSSWVEDGEPVMENFGVIHINSGRHADKAYYWFVDGWNRLDADTDEIEARLEALESINVVTSLDVDKDYKIATFADTGNVVTNSIQIDTTIPTDVQRNTLILITQPERQNEQHLIVYDDGDGNPIP